MKGLETRSMTRALKKKDPNFTNLKPSSKTSRNSRLNINSSNIKNSMHSSQPTMRWTDSKCFMPHNKSPQTLCQKLMQITRGSQIGQSNTSGSLTQSSEAVPFGDLQASTLTWLSQNKWHSYTKQVLVLLIGSPKN